MFKGFFLTALLTAFCTIAFAQVSTIQVTVSDTILVPANRISVAVSFRDTVQKPSPFEIHRDYEPADDNSTEANPYEEPVEPNFAGAYQEVTDILKKYGIPWKTAADQFPFLGGMGGMGMGKGNEDSVAKGFTADFSSKAQMDKVLPMIQAVTYANTAEMGASVDKELVDKKRLYAKLLAKARLKADGIAELAGKKAGEVYQIGSGFDNLTPEKYMESLSGGGIFGGMLKMMGNMFTEKTPDYKVPVSETMTVTFYLLK